VAERVNQTAAVFSLCPAEGPGRMSGRRHQQPNANLAQGYRYRVMGRDDNESLEKVKHRLLLDKAELP
jgi:hypothetical protein